MPVVPTYVHVCRWSVCVCTDVWGRAPPAGLFWSPEHPLGRSPKKVPCHRLAQHGSQGIHKGRDRLAGNVASSAPAICINTVPAPGHRVHTLGHCRPHTMT